jgi:hypothetical protein
VTATGGQSTKLLLCDRATGKVETLVKDSANTFKRLYFSPDGRHLWVLLPEVGLMVFDLATRQKRELPLAMRRNNLAASFAPTGRLLALATAGDRGEGPLLRVHELASNGERFRVPLAMGCARPIAFSHDGRLLASAHPDTTVLIWNLDALPEPVPAPRRLTVKELGQLWEDLSVVDSERGHLAIRLFSANPGQAVPFLGERLKPVPPVVPEQVMKFIADLDRDQFSVRAHAMNQLANWDDAILDDLQKALQRKFSLETRRRLEQFLNELTDPILSGDRLRTRRAIEVLEQIATPEARMLLQALAAGETGARRTKEARRALKWADKRSPGHP